MGGLAPPLLMVSLGACCVLLRLILCLSLLASSPAWALTPEQAARIAAGDSDDRIKALNETVVAADAGLGPFLQAVLADEVKVAGGKAYVVRGGKTSEAGTGVAVTLPAGAEDVVNNNRMRREMESALAALALFSPDVALRAKAMTDLRDQVDEGKLALLGRPRPRKPMRRSRRNSVY
jgi:urea transport system permease protein